MIDKNNKIIVEKGSQYNFLLDNSTIRYFEVLWKQCGASLFVTIAELPDVNFFVCNEVLSEFMRGQQSFNPNQLNIFFDHILHAESSMDPDWKENRFLIKEAGQTKYIVLNKVSPTDYAQILLCQNHPELTLVTNDRKMLRSGAQVIHGRIIGIPAFLNKLLTICPENKRLQVLKKTADNMFVTKHAFGESLSKNK